MLQSRSSLHLLVFRHSENCLSALFCSVSPSTKGNLVKDELYSLLLCYFLQRWNADEEKSEKKPGEVPKASSRIGGTWHPTCVMTEKITSHPECLQRSSWIARWCISQTWKTTRKVVYTTCVFPTWTHKLNLPWPLWLSAATTATDGGEQQRHSEGG